jgi:predicted metalloprotease with PDZ domain
MSNNHRTGAACYVIAFLVIAAYTAAAHASPARHIRISVNATEAPRKVLHTQLVIPASPGSLTLFYPKWLPADHSPDGPIWNLAGLKFSWQGNPIPWQQDSVDMYAFHLEVPAGADSVTANFDFLLSEPGSSIDFSASASSRILILMWHEVLLYPAGFAANQLTFDPSLQLPQGWKFSTALPVANQSGNTLTFSPVTLDQLVDSPVQSGQFMRVFELTAGAKLTHEVDVAVDDPGLLDLPPELIDAYKRLVAEANALYQSHHYRDYHFLLTLSDHVMKLGQEHHECSDDRLPERSLADPQRRLLEARLLPHEFSHSWNGQFRRPAGLATSDFQQPMKGDLLWVYEGLTEYLGTILTARSGLWTPAEAREYVALTASTLDHRPGRTWRSLQNTARAAQILYFAPAEWVSYRRGTDFYPEAVLIWLEVDVTIRKLTHGRRSLNDFCRSFLGGPDTPPMIESYILDDLIAALNGIAPNDWRSFFRERLESTDPHAPVAGITGSGWHLVYNDEPNSLIDAARTALGIGDLTSSLGLIVKSDGYIGDAIPGMAAYDGGLSPYMRIVGVNGRQFSPDELTRAIRESSSSSHPITILVSNTGSLESHEISYHSGIRYPHLERDAAHHDYLDEIFIPLVGNSRRADSP